MTEEERQRTMDFILQQQARTTAHVEELQEYRKRHAPQWEAFQASFVQLVELTRIMDERLDNGDFRGTALETRSDALETRSAVLEASMAHLAQAQAHADERVSALAASQAQTNEQMKALAVTQAHADERLSALAVTQAHADERLSALAVSQAHADERVSALIDIIIEGRNGPS